MDAISLNWGSGFDHALNELDHVCASDVVVPALCPFRQNVESKIPLVRIGRALEPPGMLIEVSIGKGLECLAAGLAAIPALLYNRVDAIGNLAPQRICSFPSVPERYVRVMANRRSRILARLRVSKPKAPRPYPSSRNPEGEAGAAEVGNLNSP
ncbi:MULTISPECIES: hypothetical protein [unclassified Bradyrhizobium]|uniref:hypothetical protein n=1 Tax=unclassified Bradyrhizobium TaxID=2631580 RepID=UPI001FFBE926|nr:MULTISPECIES: hypothetical protein [unclassified Bradyrhizobium]